MVVFVQALLSKKDFEEEIIFRLIHSLASALRIGAEYHISFVQEETKQQFEVKSNNPYFKIILGKLINRERGKVNRKVSESPAENLAFSFGYGHIYRRLERFELLIKSLQLPDEKLAASLAALRGISGIITYSVADKISEMNFHKTGDNFHLSLEPTANILDGALCIGMDIVTDDVMFNLIKFYLKKHTCHYKTSQNMLLEYPYEEGARIDGPTALSTLNKLLHLNDADFLEEKTWARLALHKQSKSSHHY